MKQVVPDDRGSLFAILVINETEDKLHFDRIKVHPGFSL